MTRQFPWRCRKIPFDSIVANGQDKRLSVQRNVTVVMKKDRLAVQPILSVMISWEYISEFLQSTFHSSLTVSPNAAAVPDDLAAAFTAAIAGSVFPGVVQL